MDLQQTWLSKLDKANKLRITEFIFEHEGCFYISKWVNNKWQEPTDLTIFIP